MKLKYLTGKDYPWLCKSCRSMVNNVVIIVQQDEMYVNDDEGPCNFVYDKGWFCGGYECIAKEELHAA